MTKKKQPPKGIQVIRGVRFDFDAIRKTADAYATAAAYYNEILNGEKMATPDIIRSAKMSAYSCCCDAQRFAGHILVDSK